MVNETLDQLIKCKSILTDLKAWMKNDKTSFKIKSILLDDKISGDLFIASKLLNIQNDLQMIYHIKHLFIEIPKCESCFVENKKYGGKRYNSTCGNKLCSRNLIAQRGSKTKTALDEHGKSIAHYTKIKTDEYLRNTIDTKTGKSLHDLRSEKIKNTLSKIDATGKSGYQKIAESAAHTKTTTFLDNGLSIAQNSRKIQIEKYKNSIDENGISDWIKLGKKISKSLKANKTLSASIKLSKQKSKRTILPDGKNLLQHSAIKAIPKCRITKEKTGNMIPLDQMSNYELYKRLVWKYTKLNNLNDMANSNLRGTLSYHLDHKFSMFEGFKQNIPTWIIGSIHNLEFIPYLKNCSKGKKCSHSLDSLMSKFYK